MYMVSFPLKTFNTTFQGLVAAKQNDSWALAGPGEEQQQQGQSRSFSPTPIENSKVFLCRTQLMIEEEERIGQLEQREQSMRQLESDIVDVNTIFKVKAGFWGFLGTDQVSVVRILQQWCMNRERLWTA